MKKALSRSAVFFMGVVLPILLLVVPLQITAQEQAELIVEPGKGVYGLQIFIKGTGFAPNSQIQIEAFSQTIAPQSDNTGQFMVMAFAPTDASKFKPGDYTIIARDAEGNTAEAAFVLEALTSTARPTRPTGAAASATQPSAPVATAGSTEAATLGGGSSNILLMIIVVGAVGLALLAIVIFLTLSRREEPSCPPTDTPPERTAPARTAAPQRPADAEAVTPGASSSDPGLGETTLVMPAIPKLSTKPTLQIVGGEGEGTTFALEQKTTVLGRGEDCDIVINHPMVSRHHAKIVRVGPSYYIHDLQSTNGTMVNGQRIDQHVLQSEDEIQIGMTLLLFTQPTSEE